MKNFIIMTDTIHEDGPPGLPMADPSTFDTLWSQRTRVDYEDDGCVRFWTGTTEGFYVIADKVLNLAVYLVHYREFTFEGKPALETALWRVISTHTIEVTDDFFLKYLLGKYHYICSMPIETERGYKLWIRLSLLGMHLRHKYGITRNPNMIDVEWEDRKSEELHQFSGPELEECDHLQVILKKRTR